jgi:hypothetical protein
MRELLQVVKLRISSLKKTFLVLLLPQQQLSATTPQEGIAKYAKKHVYLYLLFLSLLD